MEFVGGLEADYDSPQAVSAEVTKAVTPPAPSAQDGPKQQGIKLMEGERELVAGMLSKTAGFRLIVTGVVGAKEIDRLIAKLELDKEILADIDYVDGAWHFIEFTSDFAEQEFVRFATALRTQFNASATPDGCEAYRKDENGIQLVLLNPQASRLVFEMPNWRELLHSTVPPSDLGSFKPARIFR